MCSCHCWMGCWICRGSISQQSGLACPTSQVFTSSGNWNRGVIDLILDVSDQTQFPESVCNRFSLRMLWQRQLTAGYGLTFGRWPAGCPNRALVDQPCASCATCYAICVLRSTRTRSICAMHSIRASQVLRLHSSSFASNMSRYEIYIMECRQSHGISQPWSQPCSCRCFLQMGRLFWLPLLRALPGFSMWKLAAAWSPLVAKPLGAPWQWMGRWLLGVVLQFLSVFKIHEESWNRWRHQARQIPSGF